MSNVSLVSPAPPPRAPKTKLTSTFSGSSNQETEVPNLVQVLHNSFDWFTKQGIEELLKEVSPVEDFSGGRFELKFLNHEIKKPLEYWCPVDETTLEKTSTYIAKIM